MTISDVFTVLGAGAGILVLALMAATPLLFRLPQRKPRVALSPVRLQDVRIPAQRGAYDTAAPKRDHAGAA